MSAPPSIHDLRDSLPQVGRLEQILLSAERKGAITSVQEVTVRVGTGLDGDHHCSRPRKLAPKRQVTAIQAEHIAVIGALSGHPDLEAHTLRRNLVISGIPLLPLKTGRFRVGEVLFEGSGPCDPCSRMEKALGPGGYNAMRGHGGLTLKVLEGGVIRVGDAVVRVEKTDEDEAG